jgi:hypothetical protein
MLHLRAAGAIFDLWNLSRALRNATAEAPIPKIHSTKLDASGAATRMHG